jgi:hypothetical protein
MRRQVRQVIVAAALLAAATAAGSARVERPEFVVTITGPAEVSAGRASAFAVSVAASGTFHLNEDYPSSFRVADPPVGVRYPREKVDRASGIVLEPCGAGAKACSARLLVPFVADAPGTHTVGGTLAFSVCDDDRCLIERVPVSLSIAFR